MRIFQFVMVPEHVIVVEVINNVDLEAVYLGIIQQIFKGVIVFIRIFGIEILVNSWKQVLAAPNKIQPLVSKKGEDINAFLCGKVDILTCIKE